MPIWLSKLQPSPWLSRKLLMLAIVIAVGVGGFFFGRRQQASVADTKNIPIGDLNPLDPDWAKRPVAYIYDKPIYRAELGEYLIQRFGVERLDYMVNRRIVEVECAKHNIIVSDGEVDARFQLDLQSFGVNITEKEFVNSILRRFGKTLFEWKEDVIRPKIMMEKLVSATVVIFDKDIQEGFEARFGPKVECRMIVIDQRNAALAPKVWDNARKGRDAFLVEARQQFIPQLAMKQGEVPPIHKHFGDKKLEEAAFSLKEGEISSLIAMSDGTYVILLCEKHIPAATGVSLETERVKLHKEMHDLRVAQRIPLAFEELKRKANPQLVLSNKGSPSSVVPPPMPLPSEQSPVIAPSKNVAPLVVGDVKLPVLEKPKVATPLLHKEVLVPPPMPKETPKEAPKTPLSIIPTLQIPPTPPSVAPPPVTPPLPPLLPKKDK